MTETMTKAHAMRCTYLAFLLSGMGSLMVGSLLPNLRSSYGLDYTFSGLLLSAQPVGNLISNLLAGILPLYLGRKRSILILVCWMPVAYLLFAGASARVLLLTACFCIALARGAGSNFSNVVISTLAEESARGLNLLHAAFSLGALSAPFLLVFGSLLFGESGFRAAALAMAVLALVQFLLYRAVAGSDALPEAAHGGLKSADLRFLHDRVFWVSGAVLLFYISAEYAITTWMVTYMKDTGIFGDTLAQMTSSVLWVSILLGRLLTASVSGRVSRKLLLTVCAFGFFGFFLVLFCAHTPTAALFGILGLGFFMAGIYPTTFAGAAHVVAGNDLAASLLIMMGSVGGIAAPALIGRISDTVGIAGGMSTVIVLTFVLLVLILARNRLLQD
ncbi:MAG: MFS transporter [Lawsonibacter sp.]|nr:MFS transporter [Lawsonibacter sp.]